MGAYRKKAPKAALPRRLDVFEGAACGSLA